MDRVITYLIVPAFSNLAGTCRIVCRDGTFNDALSNYRAEAREWSEAGRISSLGRLLCMSGPSDLIDMMKADEPLAAGLVYVFRPE